MRRTKLPLPRYRITKRVFTGVIVIICVVLGIWLVIALIKEVRASIFLKSSRTNIVIQNNPIILLSFASIEADSDLLITLPGSVHVLVPYGYGQYRLEAVGRLGILEHKPQLLPDTIADLLGVTLDGWVQKDIDRHTNNTVLEQLQQSLTLGQVLSPQFDSNLEMLDRFLLFWKLWHLRSNVVRVYDMTQNSTIFVRSALADGSNSTEVNSDGLERFLEQKFEDAQIRLDGLTIRIFNSTDTAGIGQKFARFVTRIGGKVIAVGNQKDDEAHCRVFLRKELDQKRIVQFLQKEFNCTLSLTPNNLGADLMITVGNSFADRWK